MNEIVISRIPVSRETTPTLYAHQTYVPRETPAILKHNKTTHPTTKATRSQPTKPQQPPQTNHHVSRETYPNTQPTTTQKPYSEATQKDPQQANHQKAVTHRSLFSRWKNPFMPTDDKLERIRHLSYFSLLLKSSHACQCLETLNRISQQLNKIQLSRSNPPNRIPIHHDGRTWHYRTHYLLQPNSSSSHFSTLLSY